MFYTINGMGRVATAVAIKGSAVYVFTDPPTETEFTTGVLPYWIGVRAIVAISQNQLVLDYDALKLKVIDPGF